MRVRRRAGPPAAVNFCAQHLGELTPEERDAHKEARRSFHALGSGR